MKSDNFYFKLPVTHIITISKQDKILDLEHSRTDFLLDFAFYSISKDLL
jgi:hypothetical protein